MKGDCLLALKQGTRIYHDALERKMAPLLGTLSIQTYTTLLQKLFGYYKPLEERISALPSWHNLPVDLGRRQKAPLLARDLLWLKVAQPQLSQLIQCERLPEVKNITEALGCLYVLEGATLGGQIISRHLKKNLALDEDRGCAFFYSYGDEVGLMWESFRETLTSHCSRHGRTEEEQLVQSARETFVSLDYWLFEGGRAEWLTEDW
jgi:heme oxygenase (biliverdin-IX-beta and delta-forming)